MTYKLTIKAKSREQAVATYRYLQKILLLKKEDVEPLSETSFAIQVRKDVGEIIMRVLRDKFEGGVE